MKKNIIFADINFRFVHFSDSALEILFQAYEFKPESEYRVAFNRAGDVEIWEKNSRIWMDFHKVATVDRGAVPVVMELNKSLFDYAGSRCPEGHRLDLGICHYCKSDDLEVRSTGIGRDHKPIFWVHCWGCLGNGPRGWTKDEAIRLWNEYAVYDAESWVERSKAVHGLYWAALDDDGLAITRNDQLSIKIVAVIREGKSGEPWSRRLERAKYQKLVGPITTQQHPTQQMIDELRNPSDG